MELNLCWWNIGVSPPIKKAKKENSETIKLAKDYIKDMVEKRHLDIVALCEISQDESIDFKELANELEMDYIDLSGKIGRVIIDVSIMYEMSKLEFISSKFLTKLQPDNRAVRVGVRIVFKETEYNRFITLFLSHWPSVLSADDKVRNSAAQELRINIDNILKKYGSDSQFICMGDYNTNPYSEAMVDILYATRDYHIIKKKRELLFNPFWYLLSDKKTNNIGTYYYKFAPSNRWHVFDQMIFSSSFLYGKDDCFKLDVDKLDFHKILKDDNECLDKVFFENFDHYPIFCRILHER